MKMKFTGGVLYFILAMGLGPVASLQAAPVNPCSLITQEEMGKILGTPVKAMQVVATNRDHCQYDVSGKGLQMVNVWAHPNAKAAFENGKTGLAPIETISGFGEAAYWAPNTRILNVLKGSYYLQISFIFPGKDFAFKAAQALAAIALPRIP